jgi:hypothetical protein
MNFNKTKEWLLYGVMILFIGCTLIALSYGSEPELGNWRWSEDTLQLTHDKETHAVGSFGLYYLFVNKGMSQKKAVTSVLVLGLVKEGLDALVPWEEYGSWGGDGFSKNDIVYNVIGVGSAYIIDKLWEKKSYENKSVSVKVNPGYVRFSIYLD